MCAYRVLGAFQSHSSIDSTAPFITRDAWGVREGERLAFNVQSWHEKYGWGNSTVELYLTPADAGSNGAAIVGVRQRMSTLDSSHPWLVKGCFGCTSGEHFDFYVKAWSPEYGWGHSVVELYLDPASTTGLLNGFRQLTSNEGSTADWREIYRFGNLVEGQTSSTYALAWSDVYQWGYSRLEFDIAGVATVDPIEAILTDFSKSTTEPAWRNVDKNALIADLRQTARDAYLVNQGISPLCGPASIIFDLVRREPIRYVQICRQLYETGAIDMASIVARPGDACLRSQIKPGVTPADWVMLAGLRDAENILWPVTAGSASVAGITTPDEMVKWCVHLLGMGHVGYHSTVVFGEFDAMRACRDAVDKGGVAYLLIDSSLLTSGRPAVRYPNHWVSFLGGLSINNGVWWKHDSGSIRFDCYSWGQRRTVSKGEGTFEACMWGAVVAVP